MRSELDPAGAKLQAWVHGWIEQAAQCAVNVRMAAGELMSVSLRSWTDFSVMLLLWSMSWMIIIYSREPEVQELKHYCNECVLQRAANGRLFGWVYFCPLLIAPLRALRLSFSLFFRLQKV